MQLTHDSTFWKRRTPLAEPRASSRPVRVCFLIDRLARAGTESQLLALIRHLDRSRIEPLLCLLDGESAASRALEPACCPVIRLGVRSLLRPSSLGKAMRLARLLRDRQVDVLQVYFPDSTLFGVPVARLAGVPHVVRTRNNLGYAAGRVERWLGRLYSRLVSATVANCEPCRQAVLELERPSPAAVFVLENGVDLARFGPMVRADRDRTSEPTQVGMVANLRPIKRPDVFVRAAGIVSAARPDVRFRLAGEGELRPALQQQIDAQGLRERCQLIGAVDDVPAFLAELQVAVLSSASEGQSNALLEYMAAGRAVVATAVGDNTELIEQGVNGLLVPPGDPAALAEAILQLLNDPARAACLGAAGRRRVEERYSLPVRARRFEEFYERLVNEPSV